MARLRRIVTNLFVSLFMAIAIIISIIAVPLSVAAFLFTAATASSDPNEQHEPVIIFAMMVCVIGIVVAGWTVVRIRRRPVQK